MNFNIVLSEDVRRACARIITSKELSHVTDFDEDIYIMFTPDEIKVYDNKYSSKHTAVFRLGKWIVENNMTPENKVIEKPEHKKFLTTVNELVWASRSLDLIDAKSL